MAIDKKIKMYFLNDVEKVFEIETLPYSWLPTKQVKVEGEKGLYISRKEMLKVFEAHYLDNDLATFIRIVEATESQLTY